MAWRGLPWHGHTMHNGPFPLCAHVLAVRPCIRSLLARRPTHPICPPARPPANLPATLFGCPLTHPHAVVPTTRARRGRRALLQGVGARSGGGDLKVREATCQGHMPGPACGTWAVPASVLTTLADRAACQGHMPGPACCVSIHCKGLQTSTSSAGPGWTTLPCTLAHLPGLSAPVLHVHVLGAFPDSAAAVACGAGVAGPASARILNVVGPRPLSTCLNRHACANSLECLAVRTLRLS